MDFQHVIFVKFSKNNILEIGFTRMIATIWMQKLSSI